MQIKDQEIVLRGADTTLKFRGNQLIINGTLLGSFVVRFTPEGDVLSIALSERTSGAPTQPIGFLDDVARHKI